MNVFDWLFWLSLAVAGYAFVGYPLLAIALASRRPAPVSSANGAQPPLTVVVAARDEAANIAARVRNLLSSHYPPQHLKVLVVDDGSRDGTAAAVEAIDDPRVRVLRLPQPGGKAAALNAAMALVDTPLTVFADARQRFLPNAIAALVAPFAEPVVGAVAGELVLTETDASGDPVAANGAYWRLERALRDAEGRLGWAHAASGAIYAIRSDLFRPLPPGLLLDDVYTPLQVVRSGHVVRVAREAVAHEPATAVLAREFRRKVRTLTGNWQLIALQPWLLHPRDNPVFFAWASHKFSRLLAPWALLAALLSAPFADSALVVAAFWLQLAAYALALATILFPIVARRVPLAGTAGSFVALNAAALVSLPVWLGRRDLDGLWEALMARVLFVTSRVPWPPREGHQLRSWNLLRAAACAHEVTLLSVQRGEDGPVDAPALRAVASPVRAVPLPSLAAPRTALRLLVRTLARGEPLLVGRYVGAELETAFRKLVQHADLVHFDMLPLAALAPLVPDGIPVVLNEHNVESRLLQSQSQIETVWWRRHLKRQQFAALQRFERAACQRADAVLACSEPDAGQLRGLAPGAQVSVVPNGVDLTFFDGPGGNPGNDHSLVFVGQMGWLPNRDGIEHFLAEAFPLIRARADARLTIIGHSDGLQVPQALAASVRCTGFVEDLRPLLRDAAVYVVPLRAGSGTRLKILEAMAMGKAIVSTRIGAEGIALRDGEHALLADTPADFCAAVCSLMEDSALRLRLGEAARRLVERDYGWDAIGDRMLAVYDRVLRSKKGGQSTFSIDALACMGSTGEKVL